MLTLLRKSPIIPVIVIEDASLAVPLAQAIIAGGITILEITLRTAAALDAIKLIAEQVPQAIVGAGTVLNRDQLQQAKAAGASFAVSPGLSVQLVNSAKAKDASVRIKITCRKIFPS
jgi:2-dehydro-3-deoxyphosphogluconate aldolase/(4S)-4-hydroxy-2-oxoglutarate aldolase